MINDIETLEALSHTGTMLKAATKLRVSQSAVSKRIASLEEVVGQALIEKRGRNVQLTPYAQLLLSRLSPILAELRDAIHVVKQPSQTRLTIGVSESILGSFGAKILAQVSLKIPEIILEIHTHRSLAVIDRVGDGKYQLGLIAGSAHPDPSLEIMELYREPLVIIPSGLNPLPKSLSGLPILCIEPHSGTWSAISRRCQSLGLEVIREMESFAAVIQMAVAGFGHGVAPWGICKALGLQGNQVHFIPVQPLSRPICLVGRKHNLCRPLVKSMIELLQLEFNKFK